MQNGAWKPRRNLRMCTNQSASQRVANQHSATQTHFSQIKYFSLKIKQPCPTLPSGKANLNEGNIQSLSRVPFVFFVFVFVLVAVLCLCLFNGRDLILVASNFVPRLEFHFNINLLIETHSICMGFGWLLAVRVSTLARNQSVCFEFSIRIWRNFYAANRAFLIANAQDSIGTRALWNGRCHHALSVWIPSGRSWTSCCHRHWLCRSMFVSGGRILSWNAEKKRIVEKYTLMYSISHRRFIT